MQIAVVGIGCRYPGANNANELFENILAGRRYFREMPPERWRLADYYSADRAVPDATYAKNAALIEGFEFNPAAFKIPQSTYYATDQAQWLALAVAKDALEDANLKDIPRDSTAVILGNTLTGETSRAHVVRYRWPYVRRLIDELLDELHVSEPLRPSILDKVERRYKSPFPPVNEDNLPGSLANTIAGRICNYFDFHGGAYTVDGACSSSLLSIQEACVGLRNRFCDIALAGGVDISLDPFEMVGFAKVGALTDSDIRVYDQRANGFLPGEGCGVVVLQRLEDAVAAGNRIYAVIQGIGYSSDGKGGITAPSVLGQSFAVDRAYQVAGYSFATVELVEGHGTGTPVGDRTELTMFIHAKERSTPPAEHRCGIGSIKSVIGHTKAAAGVAGFIKATMSVYHRVLPPTKGLSLPHELFKSTEHLYPLIEGREWHSEQSPLRAAISSAGFGGVNTHITIESNESSRRPVKRTMDSAYLMQSYQDSEVFFIGASDEAAMREKLVEYASVARRLAHAELVDFAAYCGNTISDRQIRLGVAADTPQQLCARLEVAREKLAQIGTLSADGFIDYANDIYIRRQCRTPRIAFLFPGQGSQYVNMGKWWRDRYACAARHWAECDQFVGNRLSAPLPEFVYRTRYYEYRDRWSEWARQLTETAIAQPTIVATSMAVVEVLRYLGIEADVSLGHSLGEYTALWCAGALDKKTTIDLACERGVAMTPAEGQRGAMASLSLSSDAVSSMLNEVDGYATIANYNAPNQTVVSGDASAIDALVVLCQTRGVGCTKLQVGNAFHSRYMAAAGEYLRPHLRRVRIDTPSHLVASSASGDFLEQPEQIAVALEGQVTAPVQFYRAVEAVIGEDVDAFIEVGPGSALTGLLKSIVGRRRVLAFAADGGRFDDRMNWNRTLAYLFASGAPLILGRVFENRFYRPFGLPYTPKFIASPCETPVARLDLDLDLGLSAAPADRAATMLKSERKPGDAVPVKHGAEWDEAQVFALLQRLISERFGYPPEMVDPSTRLLADLNLDSIKSVDLIAQASGRLGVEAAVVEWTSLPLGEIAAHLIAACKSPRDSSAASQPAVMDDAPRWVRNFDGDWIEEPLPEKTTIRGKGERVWVVALETNDVALGLMAHLARAGFTPELCVGEPPSGDLTAETLGCVVLAPRPAKDEQDAYRIDAAQRSQQLYRLPRLLFETAKRFGAAIRKSNKPQPFFVFVTQAGGRRQATATIPEHIVGVGFVKTLHLEHLELATACLDFGVEYGAGALAERVLAEVQRLGGHVDAGYPDQTRRLVRILAPRSAVALPLAPLKFAASDVFIVTGGAKGITLECALKLLEHSGAKIAVLGSSPAPGKDRSADSVLASNLARYRDANIEAHYYSCDLSSAEAVRTTIRQVKQELGTVTGVLHGAGTNVPHLLEQTRWEDFERVLAPKMLGFANLMADLDPQALQFVIAFSSIIGQSGMPGNADYALANEWLNLALGRLRSQYPATRFMAFNYSVWGEVGMGARLNTLDRLQSIGVGAIPLREGVERFVQLSHRVWNDAEMIVAAGLGTFDTLRFENPPKSGARFLERIVRVQPGVECITEVMLNPEHDTYLRDHNYDGALLFPAVVGMEAMAEVASACLGRAGSDLPTLERVEFLKPIVVPQEGRAIRVYALADEVASDGATRRVHVRIRSSVTNYDSDYFRGECVWSPEGRALTRSAPIIAGALNVDPLAWLYGSIFFQGPTFRNIVSFHDVSARHCIGRISVPPAPSVSSRETSAAKTLLDSFAVRDCALHGIQVCVPEYRLLPVAIDRLTTRGYGNGLVTLVAEERSRTAKEFIYDLTVFDSAGRCVEEIEGYRCRVVDTYKNNEVLGRIEQIHVEARERRSTPVPLAVSA